MWIMRLWIYAPQEPAVLWEDFCSRCRDIVNFYLMKFSHFGENLEKLAENVAYMGLLLLLSGKLLTLSANNGRFNEPVEWLKIWWWWPYQQTMNLSSELIHVDNLRLSGYYKRCSISKICMSVWNKKQARRSISGKGFPLRSSGPGAILHLG